MSTDGNKNGSFYTPWGFGGFLWRALIFLLGVLLIAYLIGHNQNQGTSGDNTAADEDNPASDSNGGGFDNGHDFGDADDNVGIVADSVFANDPFDNMRDTSSVDDWRDIISDVPELPDPTNNIIPPLDSTSVVENPNDSIQYIVKDQLIVFFNSQNLNNDMSNFATKFKQLYPQDGYSIAYYNPNAGTMLLTVPQAKLADVQQELPAKITGIDFVVTTNDVVDQISRPSDRGFSQASYDQYYRLIQAYDAWDITKGSADVKVAIVDTYFDLTHKEINNRYTDCINIVTGTKDVYPPRRRPANIDEIGTYCHGTHVAGIAIGSQDNSIGCSGIAPECTWIPISVGSPTTAFNILEGVMYAIYHGADVINLSMGSSFPADVAKLPLDNQVDYVNTQNKSGEKLWQYVYKIAADHKCVICKAAGNNNILMGMDTGNRNGNFISVEAVDSKGIKAGFSNYGVVPERGMRLSVVAAPGVGIWSSTEHRSAIFWERAMEVIPELGKKVSGSEALEEMDGTSMATPFVSGAVALLKSKNKNLCTEEIIKILALTARQTDTDPAHRIGPTIQLKDALEATSTGQSMNFDEVMDNHALMIGKWKSSHVIDVLDETNQKIDEVWGYFIFNSPSNGTVEYHTLNSGRVYTAGLSVKWESGKIVISQTSAATTSDGHTLPKYIYLCQPNRSRLMEVTAQRDVSGETDYKCMFEKVN